MSDKIIIDDIEYDVPIVKLQRTADILDKSAHRSEDGVLHREVIGTYYNYTLQISHVWNLALYEELWQVLSAPEAWHDVELPNEHIKYRAYFSSIKDEGVRMTPDGFKYKNLSCKLTAMEPRRRATTRKTS